MHELHANADSVYYLITKLCENIAREYAENPITLPAAAVINHLKARAFEVLLKKTTNSSSNACSENEEFEPQRELDKQIFAAKLYAHSKNPIECGKFDDYAEQLDAISTESYFATSTGRGILQVLIALQGNINEDDDEPIMHTSELLVPGAFTLHANYVNNPHYPSYVAQSVLCAKPRYFKGITDIKSHENPYLPKFIFDGEDNKLAKIEQKYASNTHRECSTDTESDDCTFTGLARRLWGASMRINVRAFRLFADCNEIGIEKKKFNFPHASKTPSKENKPKPIAAQEPIERRIFSWNWESLGCFGMACAKPFASEANVMLHLQNWQNQASGCPFEAKILSIEQFMQDLKSLTVGIQSDTFQHDEYIVFNMQPNITIEGVLPATLENYVTDFLECGTCYKRMQTMIMKRDYKLMFEGFMFKTLCSAVDEYLLTVRQFVFAQQDQHLLAFYKRMKNMMSLITNLSYTLAIHPNVDASIKPPMGSQFIGYIYREIVRITEKDYIMLLMFILKRCCHVYFKHLQKWIFYGLLDDPSNELFICFVDHYRQNTKYFYDKAYFVRKESVPGFFQNYEDDILQCGKYTMLLKAYKPNHPLFNLDYPPLSVCLTFGEIEKLEETCAAYHERTRELCGKPFTIREMFEKQAEKKRNFFAIVSKRSRANMEKWADEQHALALIAAEQKKKRLEELTLQLQDVKQRKVAERRANVELELRTLREAEKLEEQRLLRDNINLRKRIEYYQEINDMLQIDENEELTKLNQKIKLALQIPVTTPPQQTATNRTQLPQTPLSTTTTGTDFQSCYGDDDAGSEYAECISDEFMQTFADNEKELHDLCVKNALSNTKENADEEEEATDVENANQEVYDATKAAAAAATAVVLLNSRAGTLKRSVSDVINSNVLPDANATVLKVQTAEQSMPPPAAVLSEAQRNKLKVLSREFGTYRDDTTHTRSLPDINLNTLPDSELSDLQRNRRRMMQNDLFCEYNKDPLSNRANLNLNLNTELSRNRRKVLESEYHILTGDLASTTNLTVDDVMTPMSTTSDTPLTESITEFVLNPDEKKKIDFVNGNLSKKSELKVDIQLANDATKSGVLTVSPNTAQVQATPECALNTAGVMARHHGFEFLSKEQIKKQQLEAISELPIQNDSLLKEQQQQGELHDEDSLLGLTCDYSTPYKRCIELIESNFKCPTRSPYFRLNTSPQATTIATCKSSESFRKLNLNSMSVITLTEFLKKSVILPMSIHLEILNNEVMRMFFEDLRVLDHLRSLRHYFFMMDGEFGSIICDGIIGKLEEGATPQKLLNYQMLHSILDTALSSSITGTNKNTENLSFIVNDVPETFDLASPSVLNNLSLSYRVNWPLNLILNPETLEQYSNIFRYLFKVRRISWVLERAYQLLKQAVKKNGEHILKSPQYRHIQQIRHKFYHFVHALQNHITANALQASWKTFKDDLLQAKSMEDLYRKHTIYVKRILFLCMLNRRSIEFYNTIESIFKITLRFYNNLKSREFKLRTGAEHFTHSRYEKLANDEVEFDKFIKFTIYLGNKIVRHGYQEEIGEFINLLNYNEYYMDKAI